MMRSKNRSLTTNDRTIEKARLVPSLMSCGHESDGKDKDHKHTLAPLDSTYWNYSSG